MSADFGGVGQVEDIAGYCPGVEAGRRQGEPIMASTAEQTATGQRLADARELGDFEDHAGLDDDDGWETDNSSEDDGSEEDDDSEEDDGPEDEHDFDDDSDWEDEDDSEDDDFLEDLLFRIISRGCTCATSRSGICNLHREYIDRYVGGPEPEMEYGSGFFPSGCGYDDLEGLGYEYNYS